MRHTWLAINKPWSFPVSDKNAAISAAIIAHVDAGMTPRQAIDTVLGSGAFDRIAGEIWEAFQRKG